MPGTCSCCVSTNEWLVASKHMCQWFGNHFHMLWDMIYGHRSHKSFTVRQQLIDSCLRGSGKLFRSRPTSQQTRNVIIEPGTLLPIFGATILVNYRWVKLPQLVVTIWYPKIYIYPIYPIIKWVTVAWLTEDEWHIYVRRQTRPSSFQIMACRLFGAKPSSEPIVAYCSHC